MFIYKNLNQYKESQALASQLFEAVIPRSYSEEWMVRITGPTQLKWDEGTLEKGFLSPLYYFFDKLNYRVASTLAIELLKSAGYNPKDYSHCITAIELQFLASVLLNNLQNGQDLETSTPEDLICPIPVLATAEYNARHLAPVLVLLGKEVDQDVRNWLAYRYNWADINYGVCNAMDNFWASKTHRLDDNTFAIQLQLFSQGDVLQLAIDTVLGVMGEWDGPYLKPLELFTKGVLSGFKTALEIDLITKSKKDCNPMLAEDYISSRLNMTYMENNSVSYLKHINQAIHSFEEGMAALSKVPLVLSKPLSNFATQIYYPIIEQIKTEIHAKRI